MAWTQALLHLQEVDLALAENAKHQSAIESRLRDDVELREADRVAQRCHKEAEAARKAQESIEFELSRFQIKRDLTEQNLYSGRITNARELQDLQAELQSLRRQVAKLEDELLEAMMAREEADAADQDAQARLTAIRERLERNHAALTAERDALISDAAALRTQREQLRAEIPRAIIESYDYLKDRTAGMPVAQMKGGVCSICGTELLRPTQQAVQRGQEAYCDNCRRLVVG